MKTYNHEHIQSMDELAIILLMLEYLSNKKLSLQKALKDAGIKADLRLAMTDYQISLFEHSIDSFITCKRRGVSKYWPMKFQQMPKLLESKRKKKRRKKA